MIKLSIVVALAYWFTFSSKFSLSKGDDHVKLDYVIKFNSEQDSLPLEMVTKQAFQKLKFSSQKIAELKKNKSFMINFWIEMNSEDTQSKIIVVCSLVNITIDNLKNGIVYASLKESERLLYYSFPEAESLGKHLETLSVLHIEIVEQTKYIVVNPVTDPKEGLKLRKHESILLFKALPQIVNKIENTPFLEIDVNLI
ncbi:uncharacterized protein LOC142324124 isoform X1 [Lycorma delicatula]|uniref:uncharacterized protein LOC142324124 isoform X1 n=1 Tax=Lycorma delicatula TaxID=130591 RepID=UPI003F5177C0